MKKTITFPSLNRCWLPVLLALFYSLSMSAQVVPCNLVCNDHVNASMPADECFRSFVPQDFLQNPDPSCTSYKIKLNYPYGTENIGDTAVNRSHLGYTFVYSVLDVAPNGAVRNSCWGYITVEDKAAPQPLCKNAAVSCFQVARLTEIVGTVVDNCGQNGAAAIERLTWQEWGCADSRGLGRVIREIRTWDDWGSSATCKDTLTIRKDSIERVKCPDPIALSCKVLCRKVGATGSVTDRTKYDLIQFTSNKSDATYPSPDLLLKLQKRDTFGTSLRKCVPANLKVVPFIGDSVLVIRKITGTNKDTCYLQDSCVAMYPAPGGYCKTVLTWDDQIIPTCGTGFKIRREWTIANWCSGKDTTCVQYIKIEDKEAPSIVSEGSKFEYHAVTGPHNCIANVKIDKLVIDDCDTEIKQNYIVSYPNGTHTGGVTVLSGTLPATINLPAIVAQTKGTVWHAINVSITDRCLNRTEATINVHVKDITPPNPVCDEYTQTTVDPSTCWARVYAKDLDNGSRDNCCNVLHFAVAHMDSIVAVKKQWVDYWNTTCRADYWNNKVKWDEWLETYINCFIFKDYVDLTTCGKNQVVLRVYEACGVPRFDPHVFKCSEHDWFTYNTYKLCRQWHNYQLHLASGIPSNVNCEARFAPLCNPRTWTITNYTWDQSPKYTGATLSTVNKYSQGNECEFYLETPVEAQSGSDKAPAPGNTCSARLYSDCMVTILVDDKTPPVCQEPADKTVFCDGVEGSKNEYAQDACIDNSYGSENYADGSCKDGSGKAYNAIECVKEDNTTDDTNDPTGKFYGWYGCNIYSPAHSDNDHNSVEACIFENKWSPIYCHTWLCLDSKDQAAKFDATTLFDSAVAKAGNPGSATAGTGKFFIWDNCVAPTIETKTDVYLDKCGNGWLKRTWTAKDKCDNTIICDQKIIVKHRSDFEVEFPEDISFDCANGTADPKLTGTPIIMDDECELVGVNYEDVRYDIVPDACYKIVRTWKLIDWCKYDPNAHGHESDVIVDDRKVAHKTERYCVYRHLKDNGDGYITYTQIIKVTDTLAPVVTTIPNDTLCITGGYNGAGAEPSIMCTVPNYKSKDFAANDNCSGKNVSFRYEVDKDNNGTIDFKSAPNKARVESSEITGGLSVGTHKIIVIAEDNCGNESSKSYLLTIKDCKKPTPYCYNGIATVLMPSNGEIGVWASDLNAGSYDNCTRKADLIFTFDEKGEKPSVSYTCTDIPNGVSATKEVEIWVKDQAGNKDFCRTYILLQDGSGNKCVDQAGSASLIAGTVTTETKEAVENVSMNIKSNVSMNPYMTDVKGIYAFKNLPMNQDYTITPNRDNDPTNGVTTLDLALIQKHILGVETFNSPYKLIAADIDRNKDVTAIDLVELRKLILTVYDKLPNNTSWRFVPKSFDFSSSSNPLHANFPESINISQLSKEELNKDFIGVKIGDVNASNIPHSLLGAEARESNGTLRFRIQDRTLKAGEEATIEVTSDNFSNIEGYQFSLQLAGVSISDIKSGALTIDATNFGMSKLGQGYVTTSWVDPSRGLAKTVSKGESLFTMKVKATKAVTLSEALRINSRYTKAEAYSSSSSTIQVLNVALEFGNNTSKVNYALYQNTPNPFKAQTSIGFELPKSESVTLSISDVTGKQLKSYSIDGVKGINRFTLNKSDLAGAGVLYYTIETKSFRDTKKMLLVD